MSKDIIKVIDKGDSWEINRGGQWKTAYCPWHGGECGDWCPLFSLTYYEDSEGNERPSVSLACANKVWG